MNKKSIRRGLQTICLATISIVGFLLVGCGGSSGIPRDAEIALLNKVGSDFYIWMDTEDHGDDTYCVHTMTPTGWVRTFAVQQDGGWKVLTTEEAVRICDDYLNGSSMAISKERFEDMAHVEP